MNKLNTKSETHNYSKTQYFIFEEDYTGQNNYDGNFIVIPKLQPYPILTIYNNPSTTDHKYFSCKLFYCNDCIPLYLGKIVDKISKEEKKTMIKIVRKIQGKRHFYPDSVICGKRKKITKKEIKSAQLNIRQAKKIFSC